MEFTKEIGDLLFDGYYEGGGGGNYKQRANKSAPKPFEQAKRFPFKLGKIKTTVVLTDYDDAAQFQCRLRIAKELQQHCIAFKSERGGHIYWFNRNQTIKSSNNRVKSVLTLSVDYKCGINQVKSTGEIKAADCYGVISKPDEVYREILYCNLTEAGELDEIPFYDLPMESGAKHEFFRMGDGDGRQDGLFTFMNPMKAAGHTYEQYKTAARIIDKYVFAKSLEDEFENATRPDAWENVSIAASQFGGEKKFRHNEFAEHMIKTYHIKKINGQLHLYHEGVYISGIEAIEKAMIHEIPWLKKNQRSETISYILLSAETHDMAPPHLIAFRNGIYDLRTDSLLPFSPDVVITNRIPWDYNSDAKSALVDDVLDRLSCHDAQIRDVLEEIAGACLYRSNTLAGGKMFVLLGESGNGKSTFVDMLKAMLGESNYSALDISDIPKRFKTEALSDKLANLGDDISQTYIAETSALKKVITGNTLTAEKKGQDPFMFTPYCKLIFSANVIPRINDPTGAMKRRMLIVPMNAHFSADQADYDPAITYKLQEKGCIEYFIQCAIDGLSVALDAKKYTESEKIAAETEAYSKENNPVLAFIDDLNEEDVVDQFTSEVFARFEVFCRENRYEGVSKIVFCKEINKKFGTESTIFRVNDRIASKKFTKKKPCYG